MYGDCIRKPSENKHISDILFGRSAADVPCVFHPPSHFPRHLAMTPNLPLVFFSFALENGPKGDLWLYQPLEIKTRC